MEWSDFFSDNPADVITLVGAGGKTSLMFRLAKEFSKNKAFVLTTTTTKIAAPSLSETEEIIIADDSGKLADALRKNHRLKRVVTAATGRDKAHHRLMGYPPYIIDDINSSGLFDRIIVEADGAFRKHLKAPACYEPVIPECSDTVIGVAGLSVLGTPLSETVVHRSALFSHRTKLPLGSPITPESLAAIATHPEGLFKDAPEKAHRILFLNHGETKEHAIQGERIIEILKAHHGNLSEKDARKIKGPHRIILGSALFAPHIIRCVFL